MLDAVIIGAGPAGLTAAVYLARFRRRVAVLDGGASRASWISVSHNLIGFPDGLGGKHLLDRLQVQARQYGADIIPGQVDRLERSGDGFAIFIGRRTLRASRVLLATGGLDVEPTLPGVRNAVQRGIVRFCPICDAYEVSGQKIALIAYGKCRIREALLLRVDMVRLTLWHCSRSG